MNRASELARAAVLATLASTVLPGCGRQGPREPVAAPAPPGDAPRTTAAVLSPETAPTALRVVARAASRALAVDGDRVFFGDARTDALLAAPRGGGEPFVVGRRAPLDIALTPLDVVWIGSPGDVVLAAPRSGGSPRVLRDRGIFPAIAARGSDVFVLEASGAGGSLLRITGATAGHLADLDAAPRDLVVDDDHAYVLTAATVLQIPVPRGNPVLLTRGRDFAHAAMDGGYVYATADRGATARTLVRIAKKGGAVTVLEHAVRDAPIAIHGPDVYFFDADQPMLRRVPRAGGASTIVARLEPLARVTALAIDASRIYVASADGQVLSMQVPTPVAVR